MKRSKLLSVLKATMTGELNIFKYGKRNSNQTTSKKICSFFLFTALTFLLMFTFGNYAYLIGEQLSNFNLTYLILILFSFLSIIFTIFQGIFKAQGILFDAKDNNLLLSMPIKKSTILASRLLKFLYFEYLWVFIIMIPTFAIYIYFEAPTFSFYITAFALLLCLPIIPTILVSIIGYLIQNFSIKFKFKKFFQTLISLLLMVIIIGFSYNINDWIQNIAQNAQNLNDILAKLYYPLSLFEKCFLNFDGTTLLFALLINFLPLLLYIYIFSISYFKIISKLSENETKGTYHFKTLKTRSTKRALLHKEIKRYFSSPIYVLNTILGPLLLIGLSILMLFTNFDFNKMLYESYAIDVSASFLPKVLLIFFGFVFCVSSTTASSISLEGKSFYFTKSLPINVKDIFKAKILLNLLITIPFALISIILFYLKLPLNFKDIIYLLYVTILIPNLISILGLIMNLTFPLLNGKSETLVVKQSMSVMLTMFSGFALLAIPVIIISTFNITNLDLYIETSLVLYTLLTIILYRLLNTYGIKKYRAL